jgi:hypothetical protein
MQDAGDHGLDDFALLWIEFGNGFELKPQTLIRAAFVLFKK